MGTSIKSVNSDSYVVSEVDLWRSAGVQSCVDIVVRNGRVAEIVTHASKSWLKNERIIAAKGLVLMPAGVDAQVHLRVPGQPQKETAESGLWAAVHGGVGALLTMPNTKPVIDDVAACELAHKELAPHVAKTGVRVLLSAAITKGQKGKELVDFVALKNAGVAAFTDDGVGVADDAVMRDAFKQVAAVRLPILQHAEVPGHGAVLADGPVQKQIGGPAYPVSAETDMVARDLKLLADFPGARYHVLHVSSATTIDLIENARHKGLEVSCEVSPHHLFFCADDIDPKISSFKMNPPLRSANDRKILQEALSDGRCQFMATDHAPHESEVKTENFKTSAFGTTGLETSLRVLLWMYQKGQLTAERLVDVWATAPAKFLGIDAEFGDIAVGKPFHAVLVDVKAPATTVQPEQFSGLSKNSCFNGSKLPGRIAKTLLGTHIHEIGDGH